MENNRTGLIIIFNHRFEDNIEKLKKIYEDRFPDLYFLVPFYAGDRENVIPVYANSINFEGHVAQGFDKFYREEYTHYVFAADDLILNPSLNSENIVSRLCLNRQAAYIKSLTALSDIYYLWLYYNKSLKVFYHCTFNYRSELPSEEFAISRLRKFGIEVGGITLKNLKNFQGVLDPSVFIKHPAFGISFLIALQRKKLPYPLVMGYSDFFIIPSRAIKDFCRLCGVFSAMSLFAETAIPTAMALASEEIVFEKDIPAKGKEIWSADEVEAFSTRHQYSIQNFLNSFPDDLLYVHPVKLSKWGI